MRDGGTPARSSRAILLACQLEAILYPLALALAPRFNAIPGVAGNGLFVGITSEMIVGHADGSAEIVAVQGART
jgi:ribose 5-phosphate isomerase A